MAAQVSQQSPQSGKVTNLIVTAELRYYCCVRIDKDELGEAVVRDIKAVPKLVPKKEAVPWESLPLDKLLAHITVFKEQLFTQLRNTVLDTAKQAKMQNVKPHFIYHCFARCKMKISPMPTTLVTEAI